MPRGGYRPNSGPKKGTKYKKSTGKQTRRPKISADIIADAKAERLDPLTYMLNVMNDPSAEKERRDRMAMAAAPFVHARQADAGKGKKDEKNDKAKAAGSGRFAPSAPPQLKAVK
ncbi:MAG TPA: hypothetical protein DCZ95_18285 [Verrucomicrobia bacterium]|nr:hypothetical protein [Verrucomicrobiota bacterium]